MKKYSRELIINYINGNDIEEYDINELENDKLFMKKVIYFSNDEKMYKLCSDELKKDYEFVKYIVLKFQNNIDFITTVADYFLDNSDNELERTELVLIMKDLTQNIKYQFMSKVIYEGKRLEIDLCKLKLKDERVSSEIGMGFIYIFDLYNSSDLVLKFYAENIIEDILNEYDIDLEEMLHNNFKTAEKVNEYGLNNFMIKLISLYDQMLASYLQAHLDLLLPIKNKIIKVQKDWNKYEEKKERKRYNMMLERVHNYMKDANSIFGETELVYYIANKLGVVEKLLKYDRISEEVFDYIRENLSDEYFKDVCKISFTDRMHYHNVKKIMTNILFKKDFETSEDSVGTDTKNKKCKVLKIDFNKKDK